MALTSNSREGNVLVSMSHRDAEFVLRAVRQVGRLSSFKSDKDRADRLSDLIERILNG